MTRPTALADGRAIAMVDLTESGWDENAVLPPAQSHWSFGDGTIGSEEVLVGDNLEIVIFEVGYRLFGVVDSRSDARDPAIAASGAALPTISVPNDGYVNIPYVGPVNVLGRNTKAIAAEIRERLRGLSQQADVLVRVASGPMRSVTVSGDVKNPGRIPITAAGERVLDIIASAGGPAESPSNLVVRLARGGASEEMQLDQLRAGEAQNIRLMPGDVVQLLKRQRSFSVIGAARDVAEVPLADTPVSLVEGLARAGGPIDNQADATGVFVFRYVDRDVDGAAVKVPTIFRLNLLDPRSYFIASRFRMADDDVVLIANARSAQFAKLVQMLNQFTSPVVTVDLLTR
ncbi:polysaccharide biosynthesis/export family protein [Sphingopyxis panaciterrae]